MFGFRRLVKKLFDSKAVPKPGSVTPAGKGCCGGQSGLLGAFISTTGSDTQAPVTGDRESGPGDGGRGGD